MATTLKPSAVDGLLHGNDSRDVLMYASLSLFPVFFLTIRGWTNVFFFVLFFIALSRWRSIGAGSRWAALGTDGRLLVAALASAIVAVFAGHALRGSFTWNEYDGPSRLLFAIPVFLLLHYKRVNFPQLFQYACPISILLSVLAIHFFPRVWGGLDGRITTYFVDPITLGNYAVVMGFMCLYSINILGKDSRWLTALKLAGFAAGLYISIVTESRSGWVAALVLFGLWLLIHRGALSRKSRVALACTGAAFAVLAYYGLDGVHTRINEGVNNMIAWYAGGNRETSIGIRLDLWRIAFTLFVENPLGGYGDEGYRRIVDTHPFITALVPNPEVRATMRSGFHNDITASMVRSGIFGLLSALSLFFVPTFVFWRHLRSQIPQVHAASTLGLCFVIGLLFCSFGEQVLYLKFLSSFYGLMIAALCATTLWASEQP